MKMAKLYQISKLILCFYFNIFLYQSLFSNTVYGKEESQKSLGSTITIINRDCGNGSLGCHWIFSGEPPTSMFFVFHMNTEQNINLPHFGGKNKIFQFETPDGLDVTMESEKYGKMHMVEKYSDEGITHVRP